MSIKAVHIFFIIMAIMISIIFGVWSLKFAPAGDSFYQWMGVLSLIVFIVLVIYGLNFFKKLRSL